jgi:UDP-N-acetylglucosamine:LPS N-acetylglucosamine transferase
VTGPIVITGGGTGGHIFPMQAISEALMATGVDAESLRFVGSRRGQEASLLGAGPVSLSRLPGRGIRRSLTPRALVANVGALFGLLGAVIIALGLVGRWRPSVVVSVGGYASFAASLAAYLWRRPLVLVELDATPGAAHRFFAHYALKRCTAFASNEPRTVVTGAPVRESLVRLDRSSASRREACASMQPPLDDSRTIVVVMTGSLGAARVNRAVSELALRWSGRGDLALVHVSGRRDYDEVVARRPVLDGLDYRVIAFADMSQWWRVCDIAISRSGALTVAELTALGIPSLLVPLPGAPGDHQTKNAEALAAHGAAVVLPDAQCDAATLASLLDEVAHPSTLERMATAAKALGHLDAATRIAQVVLDARRGS